MPLADYSCMRDQFEFMESGQFCFPCCVCVHITNGPNDEPCCRCDHNAAADPPYTEPATAASPCQCDSWRAALARSPYDIGECVGCGRPVVCLPDGMPWCNDCADPAPTESNSITGGGTPYRGCNGSASDCPSKKS